MFSALGRSKNNFIQPSERKTSKRQTIRTSQKVDLLSSPLASHHLASCRFAYRRAATKLKASLTIFALSVLALSAPVSAEPPQSQVFGLETLDTPQAARPPLPEGPWYQVEVYIFRQFSGKTNEFWPPKEPVNFAADFGLMTVDPVPMEAGDVAFQQVTMKDIESYDVGQLLVESQSYEMLYKAAWRQPFVGRNDAPTVFISGGNQQTSNRRELEGTLRLHKGRYLHVDAHLVLGKYEEHFKEIIANPTPAAQNSALNANNTLSAQGGGFDNSDTLIAAPEVIALEMFELKESRRMRSGELHYLDHPKFGMLIQINRIKENQG